MKLFILSILALLISAEAFAQHRPGRGGRDDRRYDRRDDRRDHRRDDRRDYRPGPSRPGRVIVVGPRYSPNRYSRRIIREIRRSPIIWSSGFGYACGRFGELMLNGRLVHNFRFSSDCMQALSDIRIYGDFCDQEDLYDQSGILEAQFTFSSECRQALGYYY